MSDRLSGAIAGNRGGRREVLMAAKAALDAADPRALVRRALSLRGETLAAGGRRYSLKGPRKIYAIGGGKCSGLMAVELESLLGDRIESGVVIVPEYQRGLPRLDRVRFARSTHPLPTEEGMAAVRRMLETADRAGEGDLVICLISGGGSALMPLPVPGVSLAELKETTRLLLDSGAEIGEINCVRKHLSQLGGGRLAGRICKAETLSLIISDVVGDDLGSVASGPTVADSTTFGMARSALKRRRIWGAVPLSVRDSIDKGAAGRVDETPKPGSPSLARVSNVMVGSNRIACEAARAHLLKRGYRVSSFRVGVTGEASSVGRMLAADARRWTGGGLKAAVWGGETTVTVRGRGTGGRNQEVALGWAEALGEAEGVTLLSMGTDGIDGPTDAAGAICDSETAARARKLGLSPGRFLAANDSYSFFRALGDLVVTGPTGTNVNDIMILVKDRP